MKKTIYTLAAGLLLAVSMSASAIDMGAIVKAQVVLGQVNQVVDKYKEVQDLLDAGTIELDVRDPKDNSSGKFILPFDGEGNLTEWADKALTAQVGAKAGEAVADKAVGALAAKVPFGGLMGSALKSKGKEAGAVMAIGGWDFIRESSSQSFNKLDDYSVYMHSQYQGTAEYEKALAAAMAIYPKLEKSHKKSVDKAYKKAKKAARKIKRN